MTLDEQAKFHAIERAKFEEWFFGKGVTSYATKMDMWCAWWGRAYLDEAAKREAQDA